MFNVFIALIISRIFFDIIIKLLLRQLQHKYFSKYIWNNCIMWYLFFQDSGTPSYILLFNANPGNFVAPELTMCPFFRWILKTRNLIVHKSGVFLCLQKKRFGIYRCPFSLAVPSLSLFHFLALFCSSPLCVCGEECVCVRVCAHKRVYKSSIL